MNLNKEVTIKTNGWKEIIKGVVMSIILCVIVYYILSDNFETAREVIAKMDHLKFTIILFPALLIINICISLGNYVIHYEDSKPKKKKK